MGAGARPVDSGTGGKWGVGHPSFHVASAWGLTARECGGPHVPLLVLLLIIVASYVWWWWWWYPCRALRVFARRVGVRSTVSTALRRSGDHHSDGTVAAPFHRLPSTRKEVCELGLWGCVFACVGHHVVGCNVTPSPRQAPEQWGGVATPPPNWLRVRRRT